MPKSRFSETEIAAPVVAYYNDMGADVYQEVQLGPMSPVADIVAVLNKRRVVVVESKASLSLAVIEQAYRWSDVANWIYVAVPPSGHRSDRAGYRVAHILLRHLGIGVIESMHYGAESSAFEISLPAVLNRKAQVDRIIKKLHDGQKTYAQAGNCNGRHWSPFKQTCMSLARYVKEHPGCTMKEALAGFEHHYSSDSSAMNALAVWIDGGKVEGVRRVSDGKKFKLYPSA